MKIVLCAVGITARSGSLYPDFGRRYRQFKGKPRTAPFAARVDIQVPAMALGDRLGNRQPQADTPLGSGCKGAKQLRQNVGCNPGSGVLHGQQYVIMRLREFDDDALAVRLWFCEGTGL